MLNFLNTTKPWIIASIVAASSSFAQDSTTPKPQKKCFNQGLEMPMNQTMAAHSYPARTEVRGSWDIYATGSYIYWQARQENMDLGMTSDSIAPAAGASVSSVQHPHFLYRSGFKLGIGANLDYDNWDVLAEYTWLHGTSYTNATSVAEGTGAFFPMQGYPVDSYFFSANQSWNLKLDFVDLVMARSYYSGTKLTLRPFFGARGGWIRQNEVTNYTGSATDLGLGATDLSVAQSTVSQGIGPRTGLDANWLLGYGFRLTTNGAADILYTRYKYNLHQIGTPLALGTGTDTAISEHHNDFLRAHAGLDLGFGWGSYFDNNNWFIDISASYGFQVFWDQNMFRAYTGGDNFAYSNAPNGNLYIHGLTANVRLDF